MYINSEKSILSRQKSCRQHNKNQICIQSEAHSGVDTGSDWMEYIDRKRNVYWIESDLISFFLFLPGGSMDEFLFLTIFSCSVRNFDGSLIRKCEEKFDGSLRRIVMIFERSLKGILMEVWEKLVRSLMEVWHEFLWKVVESYM